MKYSREKIKALSERFDLPLHVFDEEAFIKNYNQLNTAMSSLYQNYRISYSFKTNYTPYICSLVKRLGAYAEVVSGMEYVLAREIGYKDAQIIFNGPDKGTEGIKAFRKGCILNVDSLDELDIYCGEAERYNEDEFKLGFRVNLDLGQGFVSRFGMDETDLEEAFHRVSGIPNLKVAGLHCHISRCRGLEAWRKRTEYMIELSDRYFTDIPEYIDLGSGMYGSMAEDLESQFDDIPGYEDYARVTAGIMADHYKNTPGPLLFTEPGTTLISRYVECITRVESIKRVRDHSFAVLNGSIHNLGETCQLKRLPVKVIAGGNTQTDYEEIDFAGYTCLEQDILLPAYRGMLAVGDYVIFENTGGYSTVLKPPFIRPGCAMIVEKADGEYKLIKTSESYKDIFRTYIFE